MLGCCCRYDFSVIFEIFCKCVFSTLLQAVLLFYLTFHLTLQGSVMQFIGLPLFLVTFTGGPGLPAYFTLWMCYLCFTVVSNFTKLFLSFFHLLCSLMLQVFGVGALFLVHKGAVAPEMREWRWHKYMFVLGLFSAINGLLDYTIFLFGRKKGK
jgi:hypothetical protein